MTRMRDPAEIGAVVDRFLAAHPDGGVAEISAWVKSDPDLSSDPDFASDIEEAVRAVLAETPGIGDAATVRVPDPASVALPREVSPGEVLGRFELEERVARGGMGEVWKALDLELGRRVALKLVLPERVGPRSADLFQREARAGGRLAHPHVVATYDHGVDGGIAWIAQEFVADACTLRDFLSASAAQPTVPSGHDRAVAELVAKIADGLEATHAAGIVHRDLKPSNILICRGDFPKITDFGLARIEEEAALSQSGEVAGTWAYMSPEQIRGRRDEVDHRTDIFSLGALLYELIARQRPFRGDTSAQIASQILYEDPQAIRSVRPQCPVDLALICEKALEKKAVDRYPSAAALAADLRRFLAHEPIEAKAPGLPRRVTKWARRHPTASLSTVVGLIAFSITAWFAFDNARLLEESKQQEGIASTKAAEAAEAAADARAQTIRAEAALARAEELLGERDAALTAERERAEELALVVGFQQEQLGSIDPAAMGVFLRERQIELHRQLPDRPSPGGVDPADALADQLRGLDFTGLSLDVIGDALFASAVDAIDVQMEGSPLIQARLLESVADSMSRVGLPQMAVETQSRVLQILERTPDVRAQRILGSRVKLAGFHYDLGDYAVAAERAREVLDSWRGSGGEDTEQTFAAEKIAALAEIGEGKVSEALPALRGLRGRLMDAYGPFHASTVAVTMSLAIALRRTGSLAEAEGFAREVVEGIPDEGRGRATAIHNLAAILLDAKRTGEVIPLLEDVLEFRRRDLGNRHPDTLATAQNLGSAYLDTGRLDLAQDLLQEVRAAYSETFGLQHERAYLAANSLGLILKQQGRLDDAEPLYRDALLGMRTALGDDHPRTLSVMSNLGLLLVSLGRPAEAVELLRDARQGFLAVGGDQNPAVLVASNNLAMALKANGELEEAEPLYREVVDASRNRLGPEHRSTLAAMHNLAVLLVARDLVEEAEGLMRASLDIKRRTLAPGHPSTLTSVNGLAGLLARGGRSDEADALYDEAYRGRSQALGADHPVTGKTLMSFAAYFAATERSADARSLLEGWLEVTERPAEDGLVRAVRAQLDGLRSPGD
jgi:serine/threonine protein kinase/Tfp pilus assembly protein PilF